MKKMLKYIDLPQTQEFLKFLVSVPVLRVAIILILIIFLLHALSSFVSAIRWW